MKKISLFCGVLTAVLALSACGQSPAAEDHDPDKLTVVATVFPAYDFARAAEGVLKVVMVGNEAECKAAAAAGNREPLL